MRGYFGQVKSLLALLQSKLGLAWQVLITVLRAWVLVVNNWILEQFCK